MSSPATIFIAGHRGMVGNALLRALSQHSDMQLLTATRNECDLQRQDQVEAFFDKHRPDHVIIAAAKVGGIHANATYPAEFGYENLMIAANCIHAAWRTGVQRLLFLGSSCIYPREAPQPIPEEALLTSPLEVTNEAYAIAKIAGLKLCQYYRQQYGVLFHSAMPSNLYGPGDNYHRENSHVIPALLRRFHEAKHAGDSEVVVWGSGRPLREFLHVDDLAEACLHLLTVPDPPDWVNVGTGQEISIAELAHLVKEVVGFEGDIVQDITKPDGTLRKLLSVNRLSALGWTAKRELKDGLREAYASFLEHLEQGDARL
ncbi:GDP-L-fucose synthase [Phragmitibacter flavus]|uniref:GDP-L-fucose synthase n=1 Tax=Phragmitibacter flavus TaxID=2576071 RepID=A0A5R8KKC5_9BACT|nr:GDP-L-fucose synthase [Phragmitibacter flavus]TLD72700.1 GDP-L-fucose synthase [Phragmitibacter flavus]